MVATTPPKQNLYYIFLWQLTSPKLFYIWIYFYPSHLSILFCHLTFTFILPLNLSTNSFVFFKSFFLSYVLFSAVNFFHCTKYFITSLIFHLFKIFSTFYSSTFTGFGSSILFLFIGSLYLSILLTFTTKYILSFTIFFDTSLLLLYKVPHIFLSTSLLVSS